MYTLHHTAKNHIILYDLFNQLFNLHFVHKIMDRQNADCTNVLFHEVIYIKRVSL